jgi:hypothetical protein
LRAARGGHLTQEWLATSKDPDAKTSGGYWHHQRRIENGRPDALRAMPGCGPQ